MKEEKGYLIAGHYKIKLTQEPKQYIEGISLDTLGKEILPGYNLGEKTITGLYGRGFNFSNPSTQSSVDLMFGIYPSVREAQESALYYFHDMAARWTPGAKNNVDIGNSCWYRDWFDDTHIAFIRNNVFVEVFVWGKGYDATEKVALAIDSVLISGATGVQLASNSPPSLIQSVEIPTKIHVGETIKIKVKPNIINNKQPKYNFIEGFDLSTSGRHFGEYYRDKVAEGELGYKAKKVGKEKFLIYGYDDNFRISWKEVEIEIVP